MVVRWSGDAMPLGSIKSRYLDVVAATYVACRAGYSRPVVVAQADWRIGGCREKEKNVLFKKARAKTNASGSERKGNGWEKSCQDRRGESDTSWRARGTALAWTAASEQVGARRESRERTVEASRKVED